MAQLIHELFKVLSIFCIGSVGQCIYRNSVVGRGRFSELHPTRETTTLITLNEC